MVATGESSEPGLLELRLAAQLLSGPAAPDVISATRHLLAVQAQDARGARLALRVRSDAARATAIDHALTDDRTLLITWVNRGTLHLISADDEPLLHSLMTPQLRTSSDRQLRGIGMGELDVDRAVSAIVRALGETGPMTRSELRSTLEQADVPAAGQTLGHLMFRATIDGHVVRGPLVGGEHAFVLVADWLGERPRVDRDRALAELARRYLAGHGPATDADLAKWAQLPLRDVRRGLDEISAEIAVRRDGLVNLRGNGAAAPALPAARLLGPFDPLLLGWRSRDFVLDAPHRVITSNGIFRPVALIAGRVAGSWSLRSGRVDLDLWGTPGEQAPSELREEVEDVHSYLGLDPRLSRGR